MAYQKKKNPREIRQLKHRLKSLQHIADQHAFHDAGLIEESADHIKTTEHIVAEYNDLLSRADDLRDELHNRARKASRLHARIGSLVSGLFGRDSIEYQRIGGTRKSKIDYRRRSASEEE